MASVDPFSISPRGNKENIYNDRDKKSEEAKDIISEATKDKMHVKSPSYEEIKKAYLKTWTELSETEKEINKLLLSRIFGSDQKIEQLKSKKQILLENLQKLNKIMGLLDGSSAKIQLSDNPLGIDTYELPKDAVAFLEEQLKFKIARSLLNKYSRTPIVKAAIEEIKENYEKWKGNPDENNLNALKANLTMQHYNLDCLCEILDKLKEDKEVVSQIPPSQDLIDKYFRGQIIDIIDLDREAVKTEIEKVLAEIKLMNPTPKTDLDLKQKTRSIKEKRKYSPITTKALEMQAKLFEAERKGKAWSAQQADLKSRGDSANLVYQLREPDPTAAGETVAFFKEGSGGEKASGTMEQLMWDMAVIMGLEEQFTPTKETAIRTKASPKEVGETSKSWSKEGDLTVQKGLSKEKKGGVQVAQQGTTLAKYIDEPKQRKTPISHEELIKGTIATVVFGMYDAHSKNIIVDDEGKIKFFDNTRSMPSSNGVIIWGNYGLLPSYRSGLLELEGSFTRLTDVERRQIRFEIQKYASKLEELEKFLSNPQTIKRLKTFPPGWFSAKDSLKALTERIKNLQAAIDSPQVKNLRDLVFEANPDFKFFAALEIFIKASETKSVADQGFQRKYLGNVGYSTIAFIINKAQILGIDMPLIRNMCASKNPNYRIEEILEHMEKKKIEFHKLSDDDFVEKLIHNKHQADAVTSEYYDKASLELKDISRKMIPDQLYGIIITEFKQNKFVVFPVDLSKDTKAVEKIFTTNKHLEVCIIDDQSSKNLELCYRTGTGIERILLDYNKVIGKVVSKKDDQAYSVKELADIFEDELNRPLA